MTHDESCLPHPNTRGTLYYNFSNTCMAHVRHWFRDSHVVLYWYRAVARVLSNDLPAPSRDGKSAHDGMKYYCSTVVERRTGGRVVATQNAVDTGRVTRRSIPSIRAAARARSSMPLPTEGGASARRLEGRSSMAYPQQGRQQEAAAN